jgi:hypothetical protein
MPDQSSTSDKNALSRMNKQLKQTKTSDRKSSDVEKIKEDVESIRQLIHDVKSYLKK